MDQWFLFSEIPAGDVSPATVRGWQCSNVWLLLYAEGIWAGVLYTDRDWIKIESSKRGAEWVGWRQYNQPQIKGFQSAGPDIWGLRTVHLAIYNTGMRTANGSVLVCQCYQQ